LGEGSRDVYWHNGGTGGSRSFLGIVRNPFIAVVVLWSCGIDAIADDVGFGLLRMLVDRS
jgi:hypothetical protein